LIVVGTHGHGSLAAALMGSVARALCHTAGRPVLVVPPPHIAVPSDHDGAKVATA
jgi:nucleotide-binding universal stress UspA family protein